MQNVNLNEIKMQNQQEDWKNQPNAPEEQDEEKFEMMNDDEIHEAFSEIYNADEKMQNLLGSEQFQVEEKNLIIQHYRQGGVKAVEAIIEVDMEDNQAA